MKKVFPLFFLTIFLFNTAGYYIVFKSAQYQVRNEIESEIKSGISTDELTTITFSKKDLTAIQWQESGTEMRYNDEFYDVVKSTETSSSITYYCINDKKENSLFTSLGEHINTHVVANTPLKNSKKLIDNVVKLYFSNEQHFEFNSTQSYYNFFPMNLMLISTIINKNTPPPKFV